MTIRLLSVDALAAGDLVWLDHHGQTANWKHTHTFPGGPSQASFDFITHADTQHAGLEAGRRLYAYSGGALVWNGRLEQPQRGTPWSFTATGVAALGKDFTAHNSNTNIDFINDTVDQAISDGLQWFRAGTLINPAGAPAQFSLTVDDVLGRLITQGRYWSMEPNGALTTSTTLPPVKYLLAAREYPPRTLSGYATAVIVSWVDSAGGTHNYGYYASSEFVDRYNRIDSKVDMTAYGPLTAADVNIIGNALIAKYAATGLPWTGGFTVGVGQLFTPGGAVVRDLATVTAAMTVRLIRLAIGDGFLGAIDVPVGQVDYDDTAQQLTITPLAYAPDGFAASVARAHHIRLKVQ